VDLARNLIGRINVGDSLTRTAASRPDQLAVVDGDRRFSYAEFNGYVNRLAHGLAGLGYERGAALAIASGNSADFLAVYYACAKLGVVCVPVNLAWRPDEGALDSGWRADDRFAAMMPMFHTAQLNAFCTPAIMVGATIYVMPGFDPAALLGLIERQRITQIFGLPTDTAFAHGWFHSGDVGYFGDDGVLWFTDRHKDVIKTGGENVASIEVEKAIYAADPRVAETVVVGLPHQRWSEAITAFVVPKPGETIEAGELIAALKERLDAFKVPKAVILVDQLPKTSTGKIQKNVVRSEHSKYYEEG